MDIVKHAEVIVFQAKPNCLFFCCSLAGDVWMRGKELRWERYLDIDRNDCFAGTISVSDQVYIF